MTLNRDLALKSRNTLKNKTAQLQLASMAPTSEVRFAAPAVLQLRPEERLSLVVATALGALVGDADRHLCRLCRRLHGEGAAVTESGVAWAGAHPSLSVSLWAIARIRLRGALRWRTSSTDGAR